LINTISVYAKNAKISWIILSTEYILTTLCILYYMSTERKNIPLKRDQALNDATNGQLGEEPRQVPLPGESKSDSDNIRDSHIRTARKMSRDI
jgi:hypothetical protein